VIGLLALAAATAAYPVASRGRPLPQPQKVSMSCDIGPVERTFGETNWTVYACDDGSTVTISAAGNNPAKPFYFVLRLVGGRYDITGQGTGDKATSDAAAKDIRALGDDGIRDLLKTAQAVGKAKQ
jgi:hypothetical protein